MYYIQTTFIEQQVLPIWHLDSQGYFSSVQSPESCHAGPHLLPLSPPLFNCDKTSSNSLRMKHSLFTNLSGNLAPRLEIALPGTGGFESSLSQSSLDVFLGSPDPRLSQQVQGCGSLAPATALSNWSSQSNSRTVRISGLV